MRTRATREAAIAILEVDANGSIQFAKPEAKKLLYDVSAGRDAANFADIFSGDDAPDLAAAVAR